MNKSLIFIFLLFCLCGMLAMCNDAVENKDCVINQDSIPPIDTDSLPAPGELISMGVDKNLFEIDSKPALLTVKTEIKRWSISYVCEITEEDTIRFDNTDQYLDVVQTNFAKITKKDFDLHIEVTQNNGKKRIVMIELAGVGLFWEYIHIIQEES